ncbi:hypothetical protein EF384_08215 [Aerococcus agrisoli]|uniref:Uncharacterized protein n=1 Tax=Aerococcus agrisoli TaxID=2487350 RepID=A0A3N4GF97_9LACT|nr:hypothetical protein EF384_08215 [Aerococcus agrisoli]
MEILKTNKARSLFFSQREMALVGMYLAYTMKKTSNLKGIMIRYYGGFIARNFEKFKSKGFYGKTVS